MDGHARRAAAALAAIALVTLSACSHAAATRSSSGSHAGLAASPTTSTALKQPSVRDVAARNDPATRCANRVRMGLVMTSASRPLSAQLEAFARSGASAAERRVFRNTLTAYLAAGATSGPTAALELPSLSFEHLVQACRAVVK